MQTAKNRIRGIAPREGVHLLGKARWLLEFASRKLKHGARQQDQWATRSNDMTELMSKHPPASKTGPVLAEYLDRLGKNELERDDAQHAATLALDRLAQNLVQCTKPDTGLFGFFKRPNSSRSEDCRGLYLHGGVGRGKTMLMDMFFETVHVKPKRRMHFHEFLAETHEHIAQARNSVDGDPIPYVAEQIAKSARLLCFDELHVTDITDAMILSRLFEGLFGHGITVVATSNAHPDDLYKNGLNRSLFEPFIGLLHQNMKVHEVKAAKDFRLQKLTGRELYFSPVDKAAKEQMEAHWHRLTGDHPAGPMQLEVKGRTVLVPLASMGVARFSFDDLCANPLGSLDYLRIAHEFHTLLIDDIPQMTPAKRNEARRFINLIDTLYDCRVSLVASAEAEPQDLYQNGDGSDLFARTASRLTEMRSLAYLASRK